MHRVWIVDVFALIRSTRMQRTFQDGSPDRGQPSTVYVWSCGIAALGLASLNVSRGSTAPVRNSVMQPFSCHLAPRTIVATRERPLSPGSAFTACSANDRFQRWTGRSAGNVPPTPLGRAAPALGLSSAPESCHQS